MYVCTRAYTNSTSTKGKLQKVKEKKEEANWKNVQRVYGICVGHPLEMIFPNALCTLLAWLSRNSVIKLRMLSRRYLDKMGHTSPSSWKGIISPMLQEAESPPALVSDFVLVSTFMYPEEYTLTENIGEITQVTSFSLYFFRDPHFFTCPTHTPPSPPHPTNPTRDTSHESPGAVAVVGRRINNRIPKTAGNWAKT